MLQQPTDLLRFPAKTRPKMKLAVLAAMVLAVTSAQTVIPLVNKINVVYVKTADCDGCGMTDGQV